MRQYTFNKPLVESKFPPKRTDVYWVNVDEQSGQVANVMEFLNGKWYIKWVIDDAQIWEHAADHLDLSSMADLTDNSIINQWGVESQYQIDVQTAARTANLSTVISELSSLMTAVNGALPVISAAAEAATTAGDATTAEALTEAYGTLNAAIAGLNSDEHVIDNLEALDDAIDYEIE